MNPTGIDTVQDEELVAYLDGALGAAERRTVAERLAVDPALKARLDRLAAGGRPFREAFDLLTANAPSARLEAALARTVATHAAKRGGQWRWLTAVAAALVIFALGAAAGVLVPRALDRSAATREQATEGWRAVVAEYLTLYTSETLADIPDDPALRADELARVGARVGTDVSPAKVDLPDLVLKRAQVFNLGGEALVQIAYLSPTDGPVAFCIIQNGDADAAPAFEERQGKNIVYWSKGGRAFMLIGRTPRPALESLAGQLDARVS